MKLRKGDKVQIIKGKDRVRKTKAGEKMTKGNQGKVIAVLPEKARLVIEGLNLRYKHIRPKREGEKGQRVELPTSISISNVMLVCPKCSKATRVGYRLLDSDIKGKKKVRICKKCGEAID
ncbi:MAG: Ribosomal protein L24 [Parcubacteria group bacterium GW2011_GWC2_39_14]|nr:MAG: Ribosomal protein L24 [Parcubacteria group bacterium GW2011_GWC2_39_14]KKR55480.1 MAG: Ribosomal protein L24 [Parcubacteria group bacterium GW2011_GWA2_40_23]